MKKRKKYIGVPFVTINDICSSKTNFVECSASRSEFLIS